MLFNFFWNNIRVYAAFWCAFYWALWHVFCSMFRDSLCSLIISASSIYFWAVSFLQFVFRFRSGYSLTVYAASIAIVFVVFSEMLFSYDIWLFDNFLAFLYEQFSCQFCNGFGWSFSLLFHSTSSGTLYEVTNCFLWSEFDRAGVEISHHIFYCVYYSSMFNVFRFSFLELRRLSCHKFGGTLFVLLALHFILRLVAYLVICFSEILGALLVMHFNLALSNLLLSIFPISLWQP